MTIHYIFQDKINDEDCPHKFIIVKQISNFKYTLQLHKKIVPKNFHLYSLKFGKFLYFDKNQYCIYDAKNYIFTYFNHPAEFIVDTIYHYNIENALLELFEMNKF